MKRNKFLIIRSAERIASFLRLIAMVADGFLIFYMISKTPGGFSPDALNFTPQNAPYLLRITAAVLGFFVLYSSQKLLNKIREKNDFQIDNFEDMVQYSHKRKLPYGQVDDKGEMPISILLKRGTENPIEELNSLIGLEPVKKEVQKIKASFEYEKNNGTNGNNTCRHYAFLGNPGTGKTTVARIFTGLLYQNGRIKENKYLECTGNDLTGEFTGQTKVKVDSMYKRAQGGVLFIDEAYVLCEGQNSMANEAVAQLLVHMEADPFTVIIFAGYTDNMYRFFKINPGLSSRINKMVFFPDYSSEELVQIFTRFCHMQKVSISNEAASALYNIFEEKKRLNEEYNIASSNGRYARNCFNFVYEQHAFNVINNRTTVFDDEDGIGEANKSVISATDVYDVKKDILLAE